ncbi:MAG: hypothetical protein ACPL1D_02065 [Microgenomates group bacterium]
MKVNSIIKKKPYLAWDVKNWQKLSEESVLEHVLNYGDWEDVGEFIRIKGAKETAQLFYKTLKKKRINYLPEIKAYFEKYFRKYV